MKNFACELEDLLSESAFIEDFDVAWGEKEPFDIKPEPRAASVSELVELFIEYRESVSAKRKAISARERDA
jgi:hypothetical protein